MTNPVGVQEQHLPVDSRLIGSRWNRRQLLPVFKAQVLPGRVDAVGPVPGVGSAAVVCAFLSLTGGAPRALRVVLRFDAAPSR